ncbi:MAG: beta-ketoacyl synthase N-terminal-like domain-containing protein, partial [Desulfobacteraceae bacterium]
MNKTSPPPIAIVSFSGVFPGAFGCDQFWRNITNKVDATHIIPEERRIGSFDWVSAKSYEIDRAYSRHACLVDDFHFNPTGFNLDDDMMLKLDPICQWVLFASKDALDQTQTSRINKNRVGVILAAIALPTDQSSKISRDIMWHQIVHGLPGTKPAAPLSFADALSGRVVGMPATVISQGLGLGGISYTLDAACASSLYSLKLACDALESNNADMMIAGGVSRPDCLYTQIGFSQLRALSPSGRCAPFDQAADGLVVGEGAGIMVLKRLDDAISHGDTIYGVIRAIGLSNDMRGNLLAPETAGQLRAMQAAYAQAGWRPQDVDHIECHGAGTPVGDATELQSLRTLWGEGGWQKGQCAIGSIKSMIGHLLTAAGAAGMIKTLLAISHKTLPPSLKFRRPKAGSPLIDSPFRVQTDAEQWNRRASCTPRRAAVSAFGFGGINAHVLIEEWLGPDLAEKQTAAIEVSGHASAPQTRSAIAIVGMDLHLGKLNSSAAFQHAVFNGQTAIGPSHGRWRAPAYVHDHFGESPAGNFIDHISIEMGEFQIPPGEIPDILPQQLLMLKVASGAMNNAGLPLRQARERM